MHVIDVIASGGGQRWRYLLDGSCITCDRRDGDGDGL